MRNLKRALSLGLTAAMISGLMVMGSSAASSSYTDVADTDNVEAIEVLKTVGIMVGDENGDFNPDQNVTRNEMAVVMSNLMAYNVATYKDTSPFIDVPSWAEPYVAACYTNGITAGTSATTYGGDQDVTTAQAALMVMKALGYFQYASDFGSDWQLSTVSQGNRIDLFENVDSGVQEAMTRNDVAQLVLNALEAGTVEAESDGSISVGDITIVNNVKYNYVTSGRDYAKAIDDKLDTNNDGDMTKGAVVELGEKLYQGELKKADGPDTTDDLGRPATVWEYQGKEIGTFAEDADYTFTAKVTSKDLYSEVGKTAAEKYSWNVYVNGESIDYDGQDLIAHRNDNSDDFVKEAGVSSSDVTGNSVVTEVYIDTTSGEESVTVAIIYSYAAEVLKVDEDDGTITLADLDNGPARTSDTFDATGFEEDQIVIYTYSEDTNEIQDVYAAELLEGEVTRVRSETEDGVPGNGDQFIVDGTTYKYNMTVSGGERLKAEAVSNDVVAYLDANGYVAYIDESAITYDYAYVLTMGTDGEKYDNSMAGSETVYARLILTDGTIIKVETDAVEDEIDGDNGKTALLNTLVSYSVDKNDVYTLTARSDQAVTADPASDVTIENGKAGFKAMDGVSYSANSNTVFIVVDSDDKYDDYEVTVFTGIKNVPDIDGVKDSTVSAVALDNKGAVARVVYIEDGDVSGNDEVIFAIANSNAKIQKDSENGEYYEIDAVVDGAKDTLEVKAGSSSAVNALVKAIDSDAANISSTKSVVALKSMNENADGFITSAKTYTEMNADGDGVLNAGDSLYVTGTKKAEDGTVGLGGTYYAYSDDVVVARWTLEDDAIEISRINSVKNDTNDKVVAIMDGRVVIGLFIIEVKGGEEDVTTYDVTFTNYSGNTYINDANDKAIILDSKDSVSVEEGQDFQFKLAPVDGKVVDTVKIGNTVLTPDANGVYTVADMDADVTIDLTFAEAVTVTLDITSARVVVNGNVVKDGETLTCKEGEELTVEVTPANGKDTVTVTYDSNAVDGYGSEPIIYDIVVTNTGNTLKVECVAP